MSNRKLAPCGTPSARRRHRTHGETCQECYNPPKELAPCGTAMARRRHKRANIQCEACDQAKTRRDHAPCGTDSARRRHRKRNEICEACRPVRKEAPPMQPCGTPAAWRRHKRKGEPVDEACAQAIRIANRERKQRLYGYKPRLESTTPDLIEEILFLLNAGEGEARILQATGYTGRPGSLRSRLQKAGQYDLATRVFNQWELAA